MSTGRDHRSRRRALATLVILGVTGAVAAAGSFATFTDTAAVSQGNLSTATISISVPAAGASNRLTLGATNLVPGDTMQRAVNLSNDGSDDLAAIVLTTAADTSSLLDTDATDGLQLAIDKCSQAWTESGSSPAYTYTCGGTTSAVLATRAIIGAGLSLSNLSALTSGQTDYLRFTLSFPATAGNTFQNIASAITYTFTATQRTATNK